jgi:hypothetical protein
MKGEIDRNNWTTFLDEFSKRNRLRASQIEVVGDIGDQPEEHYLPFIGVSFERKGSAAGSVEFLLGGESPEDPRHLDHLVLRVEHIYPLIGNTGLEEGLGVEDKDGNKVILRFEELPEIEDRATGAPGENRP